MDDLPDAVALAAERCSTGHDHFLPYHDFQIILHPDCVADEVVRAGDSGKLCRRVLSEISLTVIVECGFAAVKVPGDGEGDDLWIKALGEGSFISPVESFFAAGKPIV